MTETKQASLWTKPFFRWLATALLGLVFLVALVIFLGASLASRTLMDSELYKTALDESDFYNRIYTDLLADPAMEEVTADILIGLELPASLADIVLSFTTSTLYLVLPPADIQAAVEGGIDAFTAYLSGESDTLASGVAFYSLDNEATSERMVDSVMATIGDLFSEARSANRATSSGYDREQVADYLAAISDGRLVPVPEELATSSVAALSPEERQALVALLIGPAAKSASPETWLQIEAALRANDLPGALTIASGLRLRDRAEEAADELVTTLQDSEKMDVVNRSAAILGQPETEIRERLGRIRSLIILFDRLIIPLEIAILVLALGGIVWIHAGNPLSLLRTTGLALVIGGVIVAVGWLLVGSALDDFLDARFLVSSDLPVSLEAMLSDVIVNVVDSAWRDVWQAAILPLALGLILLLLSWLPRLSGSTGRWLHSLKRGQKWLIAGLVFLVVLTPIAWLLLRDTARKPELVCNGHAELCDRPVNEVAYATTHNAMSITEYQWLWPSHDGSVTNQLNAGVRGFLIDSHYWDDKAYIEEEIQVLPAILQAGILDILDQIELSKRDGLYLCHMMCGLGGTELTQTLEEMKAFLDAQPNEVILIIFEDRLTPEDTAAAFAASGLEKLVYTHMDGQPWPTLRQLINDNKRVLVMAENEGPPPDYYLHAWDYTEETPYHFGSLEDFDDSSCQPNRGDTGKPFFLLNHWITRVSPSRVDATILNNYDYLLARAQRCAEERGQIPNLVGVNFYLNGDVFEVVDTLNGVSDQSADQ